MKAGRNDPCPCGSGKKYKKCCLAKHRSREPEDRLEPPEPRWDATEEKDEPVRANLSHRPDTPNAEPDPLCDAQDAPWEEFDARDYEGQTALFLETLDTPELLAEGMGFEMLDAIFHGALERGDAEGFELLVRALEERAPEVFRESAPYHLSSLIDLRVACGRLDELGPLAREMAAYAGDAIDMFSYTLDSLAYHCDLSTLVETMRIAWPGVRDAGDILPWGVEEFVDRAYRYEMMQFCGEAAAPRPDDPELIERLAFYGEPVADDFVKAFVGSLTGKVPQTRIPRKNRARWCRRVGMEFLGYLTREEGVRPGKADQGSKNLRDYLGDRLDGRLEHCPRLYDPGQRPEPREEECRRTRPRVVHVLCPDARTLEPYLVHQLGFLSAQYCTVAATMEIIPAWLRFLAQRQLIDSGEHEATLQGLAKLHADLLKLWKKLRHDPSLHEAALRTWQSPQPTPHQV